MFASTFPISTPAENKISLLRSKIPFPKKTLLTSLHCSLKHGLLPCRFPKGIDSRAAFLESLFWCLPLFSSQEKKILRFSCTCAEIQAKECNKQRGKRPKMPKKCIQYETGKEINNQSHTGRSPPSFLRVNLLIQSTPKKNILKLIYHHPTFLCQLALYHAVSKTWWTPID